MAMKPFALEENREIFSRFLEKYHISDYKGEVKFILNNIEFKFVNFSNPITFLMNQTIYGTLREEVKIALENYFQELNSDKRLISEEITSNIINQIIVLISFALKKDTVAIDNILRELKTFANNAPESDDSFLSILLDIIGMIDYAASYGAHIYAELTEFIKNRNFKEIQENIDKLPVDIKFYKNEKEAEEFLKGLKEKIKEPIKLENMRILGRA
jgi:hypothetical protein